MEDYLNGAEEQSETDDQEGSDKDRPSLDMLNEPIESLQEETLP